MFQRLNRRAGHYLLLLAVTATLYLPNLGGPFRVPHADRPGKSCRKSFAVRAAASACFPRCAKLGVCFWNALALQAVQHGDEGGVASARRSPAPLVSRYVQFAKVRDRVDEQPGIDRFAQMELKAGLQRLLTVLVARECGERRRRNRRDR